MTTSAARTTQPPGSPEGTSAAHGTGTGTGTGTGRRRPSRRGPIGRSTARAGMLLVAPAALYVAIFQIVPVVYGLILSFTEYTPLQRGAPTFVGLENYLSLLGDSDFLGALWVTARYTLQVLPPTVAIALVLAMLANRPFRGVGIFRSALYVPHIVSLTAVSMVWLWMYSQNGLFNEILGILDMSPQRWLNEPSSALNGVSAMRIWKALGSNMVLQREREVNLWG